MVKGHDIYRLMRSRSSGDDRDEFGKEEEETRLRPLLFPTVMESIPSASKRGLFSLPGEILGDIMDLLGDDRATLSALAFVNSDCRQLARSRQFANVCFDYGPTSNQLLCHLVKEASARNGDDTSDPIVRPPYIGPCIRSVTVRSIRDYVADQHSDFDDSLRGDTARTITSAERGKLQKEATDYYFETHYASLLAVMRGATPHVEMLSWYDKVCLDDNFFKIITQLPIRHLKISRAYIHNALCLDSLPPFVMSLETLYLDVSLCDEENHEYFPLDDNEDFEDASMYNDENHENASICDDEDHESASMYDDEDHEDTSMQDDEDDGDDSMCEDEDYEDASMYDDEEYKNDLMYSFAAGKTTRLSPFIKALLQRCSTTLERLSLRCMSCVGTIPFSFGPDRVNFGSLRYLNLSKCYDYPDTAAWCSLLSAPLRHLAITPGLSRYFTQSISGCQPLHHLETLVLPSFPYKDPRKAQPILDFLSRHSHVRKLSVLNGEPRVMDSCLVPLLSNGRWSNLTSLSLAWRGPGLLQTSTDIAGISAESLAAIGNIVSLEQLYLCAGEIYGCHHQWLIDHEVMRSSLRGLVNLKRLAFSRDTYIRLGLSEGDVENYYEYQFVNSDEQDMAMERPYLDRRQSTVRTLGEELTNDEVYFYDFKVSETRTWECAHRNRMLREAESYFCVLPSLEWIYCGQRPMEFRMARTLKGMRCIAVPLTRGRDSCATYLARMFRMGEGEENDDDD